MIRFALPFSPPRFLTACILAGALSACAQSRQQDALLRSLEGQQDLLRSIVELQKMQIQTLSHATAAPEDGQARQGEVKESAAALTSSPPEFCRNMTGENRDWQILAKQVVGEAAASAQANPDAPPEVEAMAADASPEEAGDAAMAIAAGEVVDEEWWVLAEGQPLHTQISRWAGEAEWKLVWKSEYEYPIEASAVFTGSFPKAVRQAVDALEDVYPPIHVTFYQNRVAVVENPDRNY